MKCIGCLLGNVCYSPVWGMCFERALSIALWALSLRRTDEPIGDPQHCNGKCDRHDETRHFGWRELYRFGERWWVKEHCLNDVRWVLWCECEWLRFEDVSVRFDVSRRWDLRGYFFEDADGVFDEVRVVEVLVGGVLLFDQGECFLGFGGVWAGLEPIDGGHSVVVDDPVASFRWDFGDPLGRDRDLALFDGLILGIDVHFPGDSDDDRRARVTVVGSECGEERLDGLWLVLPRIQVESIAGWADELGSEVRVVFGASVSDVGDRAGDKHSVERLATGGELVFRSRFSIVEFELEFRLVDLGDRRSGGWLASVVVVGTVVVGRGGVTHGLKVVWSSVVIVWLYKTEATIVSNVSNRRIADRSKNLCISHLFGEQKCRR